MITTTMAAMITPGSRNMEKSKVVETMVEPVLSTNKYWMPPNRNMRKSEVTMEGSLSHTATAPLNAPQRRVSASTTTKARRSEPVALMMKIISRQYTPICDPTLISMYPIAYTNSAPSDTIM